MNSIEMADKLADALGALLADIDGLAPEFAICKEISASSYGENARLALREYERTSTERTAREQYARRMFSRQHR